MSLKVFHLFFIAVSVAMCFGIAAWRFSAFRAAGEAGALGQAAAATLGGVALVIYAWRFVRKTKELGYL